MQNIKYFLQEMSTNVFNYKQKKASLFICSLWCNQAGTKPCCHHRPKYQSKSNYPIKVELTPKLTLLPPTGKSLKYDNKTNLSEKRAFFFYKWVGKPFHISHAFFFMPLGTLDLTWNRTPFTDKKGQVLQWPLVII